jgi:peptidoglycan biosynthesis protein MviN/MurJ (putative lipid II flippase)
MPRISSSKVGFLAGIVTAHKRVLRPKLSRALQGNKWQSINADLRWTSKAVKLLGRKEAAASIAAAVVALERSDCWT